MYMYMYINEFVYDTLDVSALNSVPARYLMRKMFIKVFDKK